MKKKVILKYCDTDNYQIRIPVYYEYENKPAWRKAFEGTKEECEKEFSLFPDFLDATYEENLQNRKRKKEEYLFYLSIKQYKKADEIKKQYHF